MNEVQMFVNKRQICEKAQYKPFIVWRIDSDKSSQQTDHSLPILRCFIAFVVIPHQINFQF